MTDREKLISICESLGLKRIENPGPGKALCLGHKEFTETPEAIVIGEGSGYSGFFAEFEFDEHGKATLHGFFE